MTKAAPGKSHRKGISLVKLTSMFPTDEAAQEWFESVIWPNGPHCPHCGSLNVQAGIKHRSMTHRCRDCPKRPMFSLKTGTAMEGSKLGYRVWAMAIYLLTTNLKSVSSMKLHRGLDICQKSAWFLAHRLREGWTIKGGAKLDGPVEVDETYVGGKRKNMSNAQRRQLAKEGAGRGAVGKVAVVGAKDRATKQVKAKVVSETDKATLQGFVADAAKPGAKVYTDEAAAYEGMPFPHETVKHSVSEYVNGMAHTNGMESFWSMFKRGYHGTFHHVSEKHLDRYVSEFSGKHNVRESDTIDQMQRVARGLTGKRLSFRELISE